MSPDQYPAQEPFTAIGAKYHDEVLRRGRDVQAIEIAYGADRYQAIAVVPAEKPNGDVFMALHGGGWTNGYKEWMLFMAPALTAQGITFVSAGYRLAPHHVFPEGYEDVLDAVAATCKAVAQYGGKPDRIFISGHSAGGHLAALAALRNDWTARRNLPANVIRGALPISGSYDFGEGSGFSMRPRFLGAPGSKCRQDRLPHSIYTARRAAFLHHLGRERLSASYANRPRLSPRPCARPASMSKPCAAGLRPSRRKLRKRRTARPLGERGGALDAGALILQPAIRVTRSKQAIRRHPRARSRRFLARFRRNPCAGRRERRRQIDAHSHPRRRASRR